MELMPLPQSSAEVLVLLRRAACLGLVNTGIVTHLSEMGAIYPKELLAYRAFCKRRTCDN